MTSAKGQGGSCRPKPCECGPPIDPCARAPGQPDRHQRAGLRQRRGRRHAARAANPLHRAQSRRELSRAARLDRQLSSATRRRRCCSACTRRAPVAIAHGYAKVTGKADGRRRAFQRRPVPRHHGDLQRLVRPHAGASCSAPPVRSMPPSGGRGSTGSTPRATRARSCATTPSGTTSRPRPRPPARRSSAPTWIANTAPMGPVYINLDAEMQEAKLAEPLAADRRRALHAASRSDGVGRAHRSKPPRCSRQPSIRSS